MYGALARASMRPRHKAAENRRRERRGTRRITASMRPRHKAAENGRPGLGAVPGRSGFNEAAA